MIGLEPMALEELPEAWASMDVEFPDNERKPLKLLEDQVRQGILDVWWLTEGDCRRGYAMLLRVGEGMALLDYLAMLDKGRGYGTACLTQLKQRYPQGLLVEAEALEPGLPPQEAALRTRRHQFYQRGGFVACGWKARVYGVVYQVFGWFRQPPADWDLCCQGEYCRLYRAQVPEPWLKAHFAIL